MIIQYHIEQLIYIIYNNTKMELFGFRIERRNKTQTDCCTTNNDALLFGNLLQDASAMNLSAVFRCVDLISDSVALLPVRVVSEDDSGCKNVNTTHNLNDVFRNGIASKIGKFNFIKLLVQSVLLRGNGFAYIMRSPDGTVIGLRFLHPDSVNIHYNNNKKNPSLLYSCKNISDSMIEPCNMIHLRKYSDDGVNGKSVLTYASRTIKTSQSAESHAKKIFENGCNLSGVLSVAGTLTEAQRKAIHESWNKSMTNGGSGLAVLQGNLDYKPITISPQDAQLLSTRLFNVDEICRFFGVNPTLIGELSHASYNTLEAAQSEFLLHCLQSFIYIIEEEFTSKLFKPSEHRLRINLDEKAILRTDKAGLASYYNTLLQSGILCINEVRRELGYKDIEGGDRHIIAYTDIKQNTVNKKADDSDGSEDINDKQDGK